MTQIWPKKAIFEFFRKMRKHYFFDSKNYAEYKKLVNSNKSIANKCHKSQFFLAFSDKMANGSFWPKWAKWNFFKTALREILSRLQALTFRKK